MKELEKLVPVMPGAIVVIVTLSKRAEYPPAYNPSPVAVVISFVANTPETLHEIPGAVADPHACLLLIVKLNRYHVL